jgi:parallel beta-helix repeat protein
MKSLVVGIIVTIIAMNIITSIDTTGEKPSIIYSDGNTFYVGGSGSNNYTKIQEAINDSNDGDTVFVYNDSSPYFENIIINKKISLIGEDKNTTIIDGSNGEDVGEVTADLVNISGFTIRGGHIGISISSNNNLLTDTMLSNNGCGISLEYWSDRNTIMGNTITLNKGRGIFLRPWCDNNTITGNTISLNNGSGIVLNPSSSGYIIYNTITGNIITLNKGYGLYTINSRRSTFSGNNISGNKGGGIFLISSTINNITNNKILKNTGENHLCNGIVIGSSDRNNIESNNISGHLFGIELFNIKDNIITGNNIHANDVGLSLDGTKNKIKNNNFIANKIHATCRVSLINSWQYNYWDNWIGLKINSSIVQKFPKVIVSIYLPWINFDWYPASEPYDI